MTALHTTEDFFIGPPRPCCHDCGAPEGSLIRTRGIDPLGKRRPRWSRRAALTWTYRNDQPEHLLCQNCHNARNIDVAERMAFEKKLIKRLMAGESPLPIPGLI